MFRYLTMRWISTIYNRLIMYMSLVTSCIICIEPYDIRIHDMKYVDRNCVCNYVVHEECIRKWLLKEPKCLICHSEMRIELPRKIQLLRNIMIWTIYYSVGIIVVWMIGFGVYNIIKHIGTIL
jgi:hypothetical protein